MREEELRSRLQALAVAGRVTPAPVAIGAVRRRARRRLLGGTALVLVGVLVAVGGVRLASEVATDPASRRLRRPPARRPRSRRPPSWARSATVPAGGP